MTVPGSQELAELRHECVRDDGVEAHRFVLAVPADLAVFVDHFPGVPLLPAFVQLTEVIRRVSRVWPDLGSWAGAPAMKFKSPIRPGSDIVLDLRRAAGADQVAFSISCAAAPCASGMLSFRRTDTGQA